MMNSSLDKRTPANAKPIEIEPTVGNQTFCHPYAVARHDAMDFLARRAYGGENSTNNYKFFETKDSYFFCTPEYLHEKYKEQHATKEGLESNHLLFYIQIRCTITIHPKDNSRHNKQSCR